MRSISHPTISQQCQMEFDKAGGESVTASGTDFMLDQLYVDTTSPTPWCTINRDTNPSKWYAIHLREQPPSL